MCEVSWLSSRQTDREWAWFGTLLAAEEAVGLGIPELSEVSEEFLARRFGSGRATEAKCASSLQGEGAYEKVLNFPLDEYKLRNFFDPESPGLFEVKRMGGWMQVLKVLKYLDFDPELSILFDLDLSPRSLLFKIPDL